MPGEPQDSGYGLECGDDYTEACRFSPDMEQQLQTLIVNSDAQECNSNLSTFLKMVVDNFYIGNKGQGLVYERVSLVALKFLSSNLFLKNYEFCIAKIMSLLVVFAEQTANCTQPNASDEQGSISFQSKCYKEFLCVIILVMLKMKNSLSHSQKPNGSPSGNILSLNSLNLAPILQNLSFVKVMSRFVSSQIAGIESGQSSLMILRFSCNILFEYLYFCEMMIDEEFEALEKECDLVPALIEALVTNDNFHNYDLDGDQFEDEEKLIAYEELKLLLLLNEQFLMKSYSSQDSKNIVFQYLLDMHTDGGINSKFTLFANLLVYHLNREESQIVKILILKFLYLVFTTSFTTTALYTNDLKILVDIIIRELNNIDWYSLTDYGSKVLYITYLKVLYPLLNFSQLSDVPRGYKNEEILNALRNIILTPSPSSDIKSDDSSEPISKLAMKCLDISWLKNAQRGAKRTQGVKGDSPNDESFTPSPSASFSNLTVSDGKGLTNLDNSSASSLSSVFTRVVSIKTTSRNDFHKSTNFNEPFDNSQGNRSTKYEQNNHNFFMNGDTKNRSQAYGNFPKIMTYGLNGEPTTPPNLSNEYIEAKSSHFNRHFKSSDHLYNPSTEEDNITHKKPLPRPPPPPPRRKPKTKPFP